MLHTEKNRPHESVACEGKQRWSSLYMRCTVVVRLESCELYSFTSITSYATDACISHVTSSLRASWHTQQHMHTLSYRQFQQILHSTNNCHLMTINSLVSLCNITCRHFLWRKINIIQFNQCNINFQDATMWLIFCSYLLKNLYVNITELSSPWNNIWNFLSSQQHSQNRNIWNLQIMSSWSAWDREGADIIWQLIVHLLHNITDRRHIGKISIINRGVDHGVWVSWSSKNM